MKKEDRRPDAWLPIVIGKYLADTGHLNTEQHGAYFLLLLAAWPRAATLPNDDAQLAAIARMTPARWKQNRAVLLAFWTVDGDVLVQKRLTEEYAKAVAFNEKQKGNGKKGGRPPKNPNETQTKPMGFDRDNPNQNPNESPIPIPKSISTGEITTTPGAAAPDAVQHDDRTGTFEGHEHPVVDDPVLPFALALTGAGFPTTRMNRELRDYVAEGGDIASLVLLAKNPKCRGKEPGYPIAWARRELAANPTEAPAHDRDNRGASRPASAVERVAARIAERERERDDRAA